MQKLVLDRTQASVKSAFQAARNHAARRGGGGGGGSASAAMDEGIENGRPWLRPRNVPPVPADKDQVRSSCL
eukprot:394737-Pleurochrysis_carterae.AAC.2